MLTRLMRWLHAVPPPSPAPAVSAASRAHAEQAYEAAVASCGRGEHREAESLARQAVDLRHDYVDAHVLLGQLCHRRRAYDEAAASYALASCFAPNHVEPRLQLGLLHLDRGALVEAEATLREALALAPNEARAHNALGAALLNLERLDEARTHFEQALALNPDLVEAHSNLSYLLFRDFEEFDAGRTHIRRALELAPDNVSVLTNYTMIMVRDDPAQVVALCDRLLAADAALDPVRLNRALALLTLGEFGRAWADYEARKSMRCNYVARAMPWPEWDGGSLTGRKIYVHTEQGLGDEIMFASCLPEIIAAADRCVVECTPKLVKTFRRSFEADVIVKPENDADVRSIAGRDIDCYSALASLPRFLRASAGDFPQHADYLKGDRDRVEFWRTRLAALPGKLKVGIAWRGGVASTQRSIRSMTLDECLPLLRTEGVDFIDLQHFESPTEVEKLRADHGIVLHRWKEAHDDYDETAALVSALDLVISVQTALVHLSGALGKETWALISAAPEWRYLARGERMPWYPAVTLCRQSQLFEWRGIVEDVAGRVRKRVHEHR